MTMTGSTQSVDTIALHSEGHNTCRTSHATPIFATSTYVFDSPEHGGRLFAGQEAGHIYTRLGNPTVETAEQVLASIEGAEGGALLFGSGMAAVHAAIMHRVNSGDHIVAGHCLYGCTYKFLAALEARWGISVTFVDTSKIDEVSAAMKPNTKILYIETPANPVNSVTDIAACAEIAHKQDCILVCDNTFLSPVLQRPLDLGADISLYSTTKNINGHGSAIGGALVFKDKEVYGQVFQFRVLTGANASPFDAFLVLQGLKTLPLRIRQMSQNSVAVAEWLASHADVKAVYHPGLDSHPQYELSKKQATGHPACLAFETHHDFDFAKNVLRNVKTCTLAVSLGCVDTLIQHPASMTHACVPPAERLKAGITDTLIRISIGIEDHRDIISDLDQAFAAAKAVKQ
ncbi:hypothetical protein RCL1_001373 [Eukaryota sp. TZLM3-RCL]